MGCVSSNLLSHEDDFARLGSSALGNHIVKLTSTTYGLLTLDPPPPSASPMTPPQKIAFSSVVSESKSLLSEPRFVRSEPEVINSWELMSGLDADSFRFSPLPKTPSKSNTSFDKENSHPNLARFKSEFPVKPILWADGDANFLERFERLCPPNGENKVVAYTTSLRGVRSTFEACNAVRSAIEGLGVAICERDVSMDRGFREELRELMRGKDKKAFVPPRVFVKGRYVGGAEEVLKMVEEGQFVGLIRGLPRKRPGGSCDGCGSIGFLPCFSCYGSCKVIQGWKNSSVVLRCPDCNENGLVLCPICS